MTDIFDAKILCKKCNIQMTGIIVHKNGLELRAVECSKCGDKIIHPADLNGLEQFKGLKDKEFNVKLRMVGNSHAISIPKEIIDFVNERHKDMRRQMDDMVKLCFEDFDTLRVSFFDDNADFENENGRVRKKVRNDGLGNIDIVEEQTLNEPMHQVKRIRIRKIRRNKDD